MEEDGALPCGQVGRFRALFVVFVLPFEAGSLCVVLGVLELCLLSGGIKSICTTTQVLFFGSSYFYREDCLLHRWLHVVLI